MYSTIPTNTVKFNCSECVTVDVCVLSVTVTLTVISFTRVKKYIKYMTELIDFN